MKPAPVIQRPDYLPIRIVLLQKFPFPIDFFKAAWSLDPPIPEIHVNLRLAPESTLQKFLAFTAPRVAIEPRGVIFNCSLLPASSFLLRKVLSFGF